MKTAKSYKFILLITAFVLSIAAAIASVSFGGNVSAASATSANTYFTGTTSAEFKDGAMVATIKDGETLEFKNKLVINDFRILFDVDSNIQSVTFEFTTNSYYVNGNKNSDGGFDKDIKHLLVLGKEKSTLNGVEISTKLVAENDIKVKVENNFLKVNNEGDTLNAYYKVKEINDITAAAIKVSADVVDSATAGGTLKIKSIDQKASGEGYKQEFKVEADKIKSASPRVALNDSFYTKTENGEYKAIKNIAKKYDLTFTAYSVFGDITASSLYLTADEGQKIWLETDTSKPNSLQFNKEGAAQFNIVSKNGEAVTAYETIVVDVVNYDEDIIEPKFTTEVAAYEAYNAAIVKAIKSEDGKHFVHLGSDFDLPSMEDLVYDNFVPYSELDYTVYYSTDSAKNKTSTKMEFELAEAGDYYFFVVFEDEAGNKLDKDEDFVTEKEDADGKGTGEYEFKQYVFRFSIDDDAPIIVTPAAKQGEGYVGAAYTASKFTIDAGGCTTTYKLFYNPSATATADSEGWVEIPKASAVTSAENIPEATKKYFSFDDVKAIAYGGNLTFTPDRVGSYMIECTATSKVSARYESSNSAVINVVEPTIVKPHNPWLEENIWSVVFLSIGTICLIGIIVLLCIKPKDETESD